MQSFCFNQGDTYQTRKMSKIYSILDIDRAKDNDLSNKEG